MLDWTEKDIKDFAKTIWPEASFSVTTYTNRVQLEVSGRGGSLDLNFRILKKFSEFFQTENINESQYTTGGCETCDYGSTTTLTLTFKP